MIGRFISQDPLQREVGRLAKRWLQSPQGLNHYSYAINNPVVYIDPTGLETKVYIEYGNVGDGTKSVAGHAFLEVARDGESTVYSWSPNAGYDDVDSPAIDLQTANIETYLAADGKNADRYDVFTFDTSVGQEQKIHEFYSELAEDNLAERVVFSTLFYNCTAAVRDAMIAGGIVSNTFSLNKGPDLPSSLQNRLRSKYNWKDKQGTIRQKILHPEHSEIMEVSSHELITTG